MKIHFLPLVTQGEAYDFSQGEAADGDIIVCRNAVAVMAQAWPVLVSGADEGVFHATAPDSPLDTIDGGKYADAARIAAMIEIH